MLVFCVFFFSSRRRHTRGALVTGVQTCALPIWPVGSVQASAVSQRLESLLKAAGIRTPVILAGHSLGGLYMRYFAATRPDLVAGLVLLDATPEDLPFRRVVVWRTKAALWLVHGLARLRLLKPLAARLKPGGKPIELTPKQAAALGRFHHVKTLVAEIASLSTIQAEVAALAADRK